MKVQRKQLVEVFDKVSPGLATRDVLAQTQSFVFYGGRCYAFNDKIAVSYPMMEGWDIELAVKAAEMHKALKKFADDEVDVSAKDGLFIITTAKTRLEVKAEAEMIKHHETIGTPEKWIKLPENFNEALRRTAMCAGRSLSRPLLTFVHVKGTTMESTDNQRLVVFKLKGKLPEMVVPAEAVGDLLGFACTEVGLWILWCNLSSRSCSCWNCIFTNCVVSYTF